MNNLLFYIIIFCITIYYLLFHVTTKNVETYENQKSCSDMKDECGFMDKDDLLKQLKNLKNTEEQKLAFFTRQAINNSEYQVPKKTKGSGPNGELIPGIDFEPKLIEENKESAKTLNNYTSRLCDIANKYNLNDNGDPEQAKNNLKETIQTLKDDIAELKSKPNYSSEELEILEDEKRELEKQLKNGIPTLAEQAKDNLKETIQTLKDDIAELKSKPNYDPEELEILEDEKREFEKQLKNKIATLPELCSLSYTPTDTDPIYDSKMIELRKRMLYDLYGQYDIGDKFKKKFERRTKKNYFKGMKYYNKYKNKSSKRWRSKRKGKKRKKRKAVNKFGFFGELKEAHYLDSLNKDDNQGDNNDNTNTSFKVPPIDQSYLDLLSSMGLKRKEPFYNLDDDIKSRIGGTIDELEEIIRSQQGDLNKLTKSNSKRGSLWNK
jgi:hypothetical protein